MPSTMTASSAFSLHTMQFWILQKIARFASRFASAEVVCPGEPDAPDHHRMWHAIWADCRQPIIVRLADTLLRPLPRQGTFQRLRDAIACHQGPGSIRFGTAIFVRHRSAYGKLIRPVRPGASWSVHILDGGKHVLPEEEREPPVKRARVRSAEGTEGAVVCIEEITCVFDAEVCWRTALAVRPLIDGSEVVGRSVGAIPRIIGFGTGWYPGCFRIEEEQAVGAAVDEAGRITCPVKRRGEVPDIVRRVDHGTAQTVIRLGADPEDQRAVHSSRSAIGNCWQLNQYSIVVR